MLNVPSNLMDNDDLWALEFDKENLTKAYDLLSNDPVQALPLLEELASRGSVFAMLYLAYAYQRKRNIDIAKSEKWLRCACEKGSFDGCCNLGISYYNFGRYDEAERIFLCDSIKNEGAAMYCLASIYIIDPNHMEQFPLARDLLERAIAIGHIPSKYGLGILYMQCRYGLRYFPRGLLLYISGIFDAIWWTFRDPSSRRLWGTPKGLVSEA